MQIPTSILNVQFIYTGGVPFPLQPLKWRSFKTVKKSMNLYRNEAKRYSQYNYVVVLNSDILCDGSLIWVAKHPELPGCKAQGRTQADALHELADARIDYIEAMLVRGESVPQPSLKKPIFRLKITT